MSSVLLANIFLGCFLVGFILTAASFLFGMEHSHGGDMHLGHGGGHGGHGHGGNGHGGDGEGSSGGGIPLLNFNSLALFLTWFGAVGYVLNQQARVGPLVSVIAAVLSGFAGAIIICMFVNKFLLKGDTTMREMDYYLPGTLARVTSSIREGGAGEIVYVQGGTRKTAGARSDESTAHPQGQEVVIVRYEKGMAYVRAVENDELGLAPEISAEA
jgi:membrane protein implicated in regulation of membrane protease activity